MSDDIVHRLRNPSHWLFRIVGPKSGATVQGESDAPREAADEIERLRAELAAERERVQELEEYARQMASDAQEAERREEAAIECQDEALADVAKLREALKPFKASADRADSDDLADTDATYVVVAHLRHARAVLKEVGGVDE